ncbi:MAG: DEAD/DEAH box helicase, partial [Candidatus Odinarchaeia archaeon]
MEIIYDKYSLVFLAQKNKKNKCEIAFIPKHLNVKNISPVYTGTVKFEKINGKLRPISLLLIINKRQVNLASKELIKALRMCGRIFIPTNFSPSFTDELIKMFKDFQIPEEKILLEEFCSFCKIENKYTILKDNNYFNVNDKRICFRCAKKELIRELRFRGLKQTLKIANFLEKILLKLKDVNKVLNFLFSQKWIFQPELTKYDTIPAEEIKEEIKVEELDIPHLIKKNLIDRGITYLLPPQIMAVKKGLLEDKSLLIVSATSSGKTLLGELAGLKKLIEKKEKLLFLVPLVALANQIYTDFKDRYQAYGFKIAIKVGMPQIEVGEDELVIVDEDISNADIIVATYEGFDVVLRSNLESAPKNIGTIVIDEIQMLSDEERGSELEGLLGRIKMIYPKSQIICLSATIGNPEEIAETYELNLVTYKGRPIPLERHLILTLTPEDKLASILKLVKNEYNYISKSGFRGQTIIFTNSRRRTEEIANYLKEKSVKAVAYHAGMTYSKRKMIEESYINGIYQAIVTTFALGAGFNAPCSQVIFESLMMGKDYLTVGMFQQMLGRAGRLGKHDRGKVIILIQLGRKMVGLNQTEDQVAINLLEGKIEPVAVYSGFEEQLEQTLATISVFNQFEKTKISKLQKLIPSIKENLDEIIHQLKQLNYIKEENNKIHITELGK